MDRIQAARTFVAIVEQGSMVGAAQALDLSRSKVTRYLAEMEGWANARLLHRSTRRQSLTPAGEAILQQCRKLLDLADSVPQQSQSADAKPIGLLRIACAQFVAETLFTNSFASEFQRKYPQIILDIQIANRSVDLVAERIDLGIRITNDLDSNLIAKKFGECNSTVCASPSYLSSVAVPKNPSDLGQQNCLTYTYFGSSVWELSDDEQAYSVPVSGSLSSSESGILLRATLAGCGISMLPRFSAAPHIQRGELVELLPRFRATSLGMYGIYHSRDNMSLALRTLIDELAAYFGSIDL